MQRFRKSLALSTAGVFAASLAATAAFGFGNGSTKLLRTLVRAESPNASYSGAFDQFEDAKISFPVPTGQKRLVKARFTAESSCVGITPNDVCMVRIIARNKTSSNSVEMEPAGGTRAFDSATSATTGDGRESHAIERSLRIGPGNWDIRVEWGTQSSGGNGVTFSIFSYHLSVEIWE